MANHNGSRRVNGVRCAVYAACATKQERRRTWTVTHSYLHLLRTNERTNERFFPLISRDRGNAFATQDAPCHRRSRSDRNSITKLFSRPAPIPVDKFPQCGLRAHRATDPIARPSCNREKGAARGESVLIPRVGWDGSDGIERLASNFGWNNFCSIFLYRKLVFFF